MSIKVVVNDSSGIRRDDLQLCVGVTIHHSVEYIKRVIAENWAYPVAKQKLFRLGETSPLGDDHTFGQEEIVLELFVAFQDNFIPVELEDMICPLSGRLLQKPKWYSDGNIYSAEYMEDLVKTYSPTAMKPISPYSGQQVYADKEAKGRYLDMQEAKKEKLDEYLRSRLRLAKDPDNDPPQYIKDLGVIFDALDEIFEITKKDYFARIDQIPQIDLLGGESVGKSRLAEALLNIAMFPFSDERETKMATEVHFIRSPEFKVGTVQVVETSTGATILGPNAWTPVAGLEILLKIQSDYTHASDICTDKKLIVKIYDPNTPPFIFRDNIGFFDDDESANAQKLAASMKADLETRRDRTIWIGVEQQKQPFSNSQAVQFLEENRLVGNALGVVSKVDTANKEKFDARCLLATSNTEKRSLGIELKGFGLGWAPSMRRPLSEDPYDLAPSQLSGFRRLALMKENEESFFTSGEAKVLTARSPGRATAAVGTEIGWKADYEVNCARLLVGSAACVGTGGILRKLSAKYREILTPWARVVHDELCVQEQILIQKDRDYGVPRTHRFMDRDARKILANLVVSSMKAVFEVRFNEFVGEFSADLATFKQGLVTKMNQITVDKVPPFDSAARIRFVLESLYQYAESLLKVGSENNVWKFWIEKIVSLFAEDASELRCARFDLSGVVKSCLHELFSEKGGEFGDDIRYFLNLPAPDEEAVEEFKKCFFGLALVKPAYSEDGKECKLTFEPSVADTLMHILYSSLKDSLYVDVWNRLSTVIITAITDVPDVDENGTLADPLENCFRAREATLRELAFTTKAIQSLKKDFDF